MILLSAKFGRSVQVAPNNWVAANLRHVARLEDFRVEQHELKQAAACVVGPQLEFRPRQGVQVLGDKLLADYGRN